jgi:HipA-like protein
MIKVWTDAAEAGLLDRHGERSSTFAYLPGVLPAREVSVTMPLRLESWSAPFGLLPVFEMNLPEGVLREGLRLAFAKATGTFDEFDLLSIVGRSQVGRIRYTRDKEHLHEDVPFQSVDEILERRRGGELPCKMGNWNDSLVQIWPIQKPTVQWPPKVSFSNGGPQGIAYLMDRWRMGVEVQKVVRAAPKA